ncbi:MAG: ATP-binding protein [Planctomycetia bacterium]
MLKVYNSGGGRLVERLVQRRNRYFDGRPGLHVTFTSRGDVAAMQRLEPVVVEAANRIDERPRLRDALTRGAGDVDRTVVDDLWLALDEVFTNIVHYAYCDADDHVVVVGVERLADRVVVTVEDDGRPFDPLRHPAPDLGRPLEERPIGGLGIHFMRSVMDRVTYRRRDGRNVLRLVRRIGVVLADDDPPADGFDEASSPNRLGFQGETAMAAWKADDVIRRDGDRIVVQPVGDLDSTTGPQLETAMLAAIDHGARWVVVDLAAVPYVGSTALRAFLAVFRRLDQAGGVRFSGLTPAVKKVFDLSGFSFRVDLFETLAEATSDFPPIARPIS